MEASTHPDRTIILSALAFGAMGGLLLGSYLWRSGANEHKLSRHLGTLSRVMEEIDQYRELAEDVRSGKWTPEEALEELDSIYGYFNE